MRFAVFVACCVASGGALGMLPIERLFPQTVQTFQAMIALGDNPADFKLNLSNLNPRKAYEEVMKTITSGEAGTP